MLLPREDYIDKKGFDLNLLVKYVSLFENNRFASVEDGPRALGDFLTFDLSVGYTINSKVPVRYYFKARNLTNDKYSTVIGYPDYGRMIFAGIQIKFKGNSRVEK